jgi:hypothetical protein
MRRQDIHAMMRIGLLALSVCAAAPALAQSSYISSDRKLNDNGSVNEPSPVAGNAAAAGRAARGRRLVNYQAPTLQHQYYPSVRKADDNGRSASPVPAISATSVSTTLIERDLAVPVRGLVVVPDRPRRRS